MDALIYKVVMIDGDYAILVNGDTEKSVARALLPYDIDEGDELIYDNFCYSKAEY